MPLEAHGVRRMVHRRSFTARRRTRRRRRSDRPQRRRGTVARRSRRPLRAMMATSPRSVEPRHRVDIAAMTAPAMMWPLVRRLSETDVGQHARRGPPRHDACHPPPPRHQSALPSARRLRGVGTPTPNSRCRVRAAATRYIAQRIDRDVGDEHHRGGARPGTMDDGVYHRQGAAATRVGHRERRSARWRSLACKLLPRAARADAACRGSRSSAASPPSSARRRCSSARS